MIKYCCLVPSCPLSAEVYFLHSPEGLPTSYPGEGSKWWKPFLTQHWEVWFSTSIYRKTIPSSARAKPVWHRWVGSVDFQMLSISLGKGALHQSISRLPSIAPPPPQKTIQCRKRRWGGNVTEHFSHGEWDWHCSFVLQKNSGAANCQLTHKTSWKHH